MTDLRALLTRAGEVLKPFAKLEWGAAAGIGYRTIQDARALHAEITAALADAPITTEQLDKLQFGRVLHERPVPELPEPPTD